jgi:hypothetical protein
MEIANLEHRLAFWKEQRANLQKMRRHLYYLGPVTLVACLVIPIAGTILTGGELLMTIFLLGLSLASFALIFLVVQMIIRVFNLKLSRYVSYAVFVREAIAECESRLAELRAKS